MNINYINESVVSVAVMRRKHTHMQGQQGEGSVGKMFVVFLQSFSESITEKLAND